MVVAGNRCAWQADYLIRIGLAVLLERFKKRSEEREMEDKPSASRPTEQLRDMLGHMAVARVLADVNEQKLPRSDLGRLLNHRLYETE